MPQNNEFEKVKAWQLGVIGLVVAPMAFFTFRFLGANTKGERPASKPSASPPRLLAVDPPREPSQLNKTAAVARFTEGSIQVLPEPQYDRRTRAVFLTIEDANHRSSLDDDRSVNIHSVQILRGYSWTWKNAQLVGRDGETKLFSLPLGDLPPPKFHDLDLREVGCPVQVSVWHPATHETYYGRDATGFAFELKSSLPEHQFLTVQPLATPWVSRMDANAVSLEHPQTYHADFPYAAMSQKLKVRVDRWRHQISTQEVDISGIQLVQKNGKVGMTVSKPIQVPCMGSTVTVPVQYWGPRRPGKGRDVRVIAIRMDYKFPTHIEADAPASAAGATSPQIRYELVSPMPAALHLATINLGGKTYLAPLSTEPVLYGPVKFRVRVVKDQVVHVGTGEYVVRIRQSDKATD